MSHKDKEKRRAYRKAYYKANKEKWEIYNSKVYKKAWREANPEKIKAGSRAYRKTNAEKIKLAKKVWRDANIEHIKAWNKGWVQANPKKTRQYNHKRRALKQKVPFEPINENIIFLRDGWVCQHCKKRVSKILRGPHPLSASLDHILPLSKGGTHTYKNVQLAHYGCNSGKKDGILPQGEQLRIF